MDSTGDGQEHEDAWIYADADLRWEAITRVLGFVVASTTLLAASGAWLVVSGQLVDGLCQTPTANTDKSLLEMCQGRLEVDGAQIGVLAEAALPAATVLACTASALIVLGAVVISGVAEQTKGLAAKMETPLIWAARSLAFIASCAAVWLVILSVDRVLEVRSLL